MTPLTPITIGEANQHLAAARNLIEQAVNRKGKSIAKPIAWGRDHDYLLYAIRETWVEYEKLVRSTNFTTLTLREQTKIRKVLTINTRAAAKKCAYRYMAEHEYAASPLDDALPKNLFRKIHARQAKRYAKQEITTLTNPDVVTPVNEQPMILAASVTFPNLDKITGRIDRAVDDLRNHWQAAMKLPNLTMEDQFLLTQTALTYLPDAWRMYANLDSMPAKITRQATDMLQAQIEVLNGRIKTLIDRDGDKALNQLRAHTAFIQQKRVTKTAAPVLQLD